MASNDRVGMGGSDLAGFSRQLCMVDRVPQFRHSGSLPSRRLNVKPTPPKVVPCHILRTPKTWPRPSLARRQVGLCVVLAIAAKSSGERRLAGNLCGELTRRRRPGGGKLGTEEQRSQPIAQSRKAGGILQSGRASGRLRSPQVQVSAKLCSRAKTSHFSAEAKYRSLIQAKSDSAARRRWWSAIVRNS